MGNEARIFKRKKSNRGNTDPTCRYALGGLRTIGLDRRLSTEDSTSTTGSQTTFVDSYETRRVVIAVGLEFHEDELTRELSDFQYLERTLGSDFAVSSDRRTAEYVSDAQRVTYEFELKFSKSDYKTALETEGIIAVYSGHSRYGRGACLDDYTGTGARTGEQYEDGNDTNDGLFRLGYPYIAVPFEDVRHHEYHFRPIPVEQDQPPQERDHPFSIHPEARGRISRVTLPEDLRQYVRPASRSASHSYWGKRGRETSLLFNAGWSGTSASPYDLGSVSIRCKTFCHFGCSSRQHFWQIVRHESYKAWQRTTPPTDRFAYFTTAPSDSRTYYWFQYLLQYPTQNNDQSWWECLEWAKRKANIKLNRKRAGFNIY